MTLDMHAGLCPAWKFRGEIPGAKCNCAELKALPSHPARSSRLRLMNRRGYDARDQAERNLMREDYDETVSL
jgi:hypothetical protein